MYPCVVAGKFVDQRNVTLCLKLSTVTINQAEAIRDKHWLLSYNQEMLSSCVSSGCCSCTVVFKPFAT